MDILLAISFWGFILWVCWKWFLRDIVNGFSATKIAKAQIAARKISDEDYFEMAAKEVQNGQIRPGLWAKAWSEASGDDQKAKALYLKLRVTSMKDEAAKFFMDGITDSSSVAKTTSKTVVKRPVSFKCSPDFI